MGRPIRHRVSLQSDVKLVTLQGEVVAPESPPRTLYGYACEPLASTLCVVLEDGRELLVYAKDVAMPPRETEEDAPDTDRNPDSWREAS